MSLTQHLARSHWKGCKEPKGSLTPKLKKKSYYVLLDPQWRRVLYNIKHEESLLLHKIILSTFSWGGKVEKEREEPKALELFSWLGTQLCFAILFTTNFQVKNSTRTLAGSIRSQNIIKTSYKLFTFHFMGLIIILQYYIPHGWYFARFQFLKAPSWSLHKHLST